MTPNDRLRILFAGTPDFAVPPLLQLVGAGHVPLAVLTQPDRPAGRGRKLQASPVKQAALEAGIEVHQPTSLRDLDAIDMLGSCQADLMVVVAYGLILPAEVLELPRYGCWNIHASLLPRWRGAAPIQRAIEAGDAESGVCIMQMEEGLDTGPVLHRVTTPLAADETGGSLHDRLSAMGAAALLHCVGKLGEGTLGEPEAQPETGVTYARKLDKKEAQLDWREPAAVLERRIRAFDPWPVAWCMIGDERTRVWRAAASRPEPGAKPGTVLGAGKGGIRVATGDGVLTLLELQRPGKKRSSAADYLNARTVPEYLEIPP